jgi:RNA polymerase primary sigma factor
MPTVDELALHMKISPKKLKIIKKAVKAYSAPTQSGGGAEEGEMTIEEMVSDLNTPTPDQQVLDGDELRHMRELLSTIDEREAKILKLRYGLDGEEPMTLKEIGQRIGLTRERVRQIEHETLRKLRDAMVIEGK